MRSDHASIVNELLVDMSLLDGQIFRLRIEHGWQDAVRPLRRLYGHRSDFDQVLMNLLRIVTKGYRCREEELRLLDIRRSLEPDWYQKSDRVGYTCYVDRFCGVLSRLADHIPYLQQLGVNYLHLMPLLKPREGPNDGGYAVADYRQVRQDLGTMDDLRQVARNLREHGISLCTDLVMNHTAMEHDWAKRALDGDERYQAYYMMYPDRTIPDAFEQTLPEVFPDFAPGNFTYYPAIDRWVWTTFNAYQWDLNYANPDVLGEMLDVMLFLANQGVEVLRLDAVAFTWKRLGTTSQNQPEAHFILQALRALTRIAAPGLILKAEAIVSPPDLIPYLGLGEATGKECELAYHNVLMVMLWSCLAEREVGLATYALRQMPPTPLSSAWVTYVRCHDDIGWAVTDDDAAGVGLNGFAHRAFLSDFYSGRFPGSFARGETFQFNPKTMDRRISGSCASLAGLEMALESQDAQEIERAVDRVLLLYSIIFAFGGVPLIYMGDELGCLNDYRYVDTLDHADDNRWLHRPKMNWDRVKQVEDKGSAAGRLFLGFQQLAHARKALPALHAAASTIPVWTHNDAVLGILRQSSRGRVLLLGNFSEVDQRVPGYRLPELGFSAEIMDWLTAQPMSGQQDVWMAPYQSRWIIYPDSFATSPEPIQEG